MRQEAEEDCCCDNPGDGPNATNDHHGQDGDGFNEPKAIGAYVFDVMGINPTCDPGKGDPKPTKLPVGLEDESTVGVGVWTDKCETPVEKWMLQRYRWNILDNPTVFEPADDIKIGYVANKPAKHTAENNARELSMPVNPLV